jgi:hypothetical protein
MTTLKKGLLWVAGCLTLVFALSIGLSWYSFGYLDTQTIAWMALMLVPILGAIAWVALGESQRDRATNATWQDAKAGKENLGLESPVLRQWGRETVGSWVDAPVGKDKRELEMPVSQKVG